jgi:hypothetical protein
MTTQFITDKNKFIGSLNNTKTKTVKEFGAWIKGRVIDDLNYSQLEAVYSIPTSIDNHTISDIKAVHLIDCRGVIIADQSDLVCSDDAAVRQVVEGLLDNLDDNNFTLIIESNRNNNIQRHDVDVCATHLMLAVTAALDDIISIVYNESIDEEAINEAVEHCVRHHKQMEVSFEGGNSYKILSVSACAVGSEA